MPWKIVASAGYALRGLRFLLEERNARLLLAGTVVAVGAGLHFRLTGLEWCTVVLAITALWVAEGLNSALERLTDLVSPGFHPLAGKAKDIAAGAVLIALAGAISIGVIIFGPRLV
ncbi:MAG TPA: diacylglycerol kinase family protein [Burkholderiales bacterium]|nr:diacylglycerol kinase family protein [Burkholderiales bacterium]